MKAEAKSRFSPLEKFTIRVIEKKFETLAQNCEHRFIDSGELSNCAYHPSAVGYCQPELCPRLRPKLSERVGVNEVRQRNSKGGK